MATNLGGDRPMPRTMIRSLAIILMVATGALGTAHAEIQVVARCGQGFLEEVDGYRVLHVKGTPYEMGYQHGALLRDHVRENARFLFEEKAKELKVEAAGIKLLYPKRAVAGIAATERKFVPDRFHEE